MKDKHTENVCVSLLGYLLGVSILALCLKVAWCALALPFGAPGLPFPAALAAVVLINYLKRAR